MLSKHFESFFCHALGAFDADLRPRSAIINPSSDGEPEALPIAMGYIGDGLRFMESWHAKDFYTATSAGPCSKLLA